MYPGLHWFSMTFARLTLWVNFLVNGIYSLARNPTYLGLLLPSQGWVARGAG
jgi:protein-S-isoprenylcysteine O-methyltransferase Ste14